MKRGYLLVGLLALALVGCIDSTTKVIVAPDGSGTIERTIVVSKQLVDFLLGMGMKSDAASVEADLLNEGSLKAQARQMGSGVALVTAQKVTTAKGNGYRAVYSFSDVTKVKLDQNPASELTMPSGGASSAQASSPEYLTFQFKKGTPATLTVLAPKVQPSTASARPQASGADAEQMMAALRPLYSDLHIAVSVQVQGTITATNAAFVEGATVTLMDMDFGKILADDAVLKKLSSSQTQSVREVQEMVKAIPGVKLDMQESIGISFR